MEFDLVNFIIVLIFLIADDNFYTNIEALASVHSKFEPDLKKKNNINNQITFAAAAALLKKYFR
jgi:hypothetical protein